MAADVTTIQPTQANHRTGPILCVDDSHRHYFVDKRSIQPIVYIHTTNNQSAPYQGVLRRENKETLNNKQDYYFVYTARHEGLNLEEGVHVTFGEDNTNIPCTKIVPVGRTTSQLELDNKKCETIDDFLSLHGDAKSSNIPIDIIHDSTSNTKTGRLGKKRDPMKEEDLRVIVQEYTCLMAIDLQYIKPLLFQQSILDRDDIDLLERASNISRGKATEKLLDIIMYKSGYDVFPIFVECLELSGYEELANKLQRSSFRC